MSIWTIVIVVLVLMVLFTIAGWIFASCTEDTEVSILKVIVFLLLFNSIIATIVYLMRVNSNKNNEQEENEFDVTGDNVWLKGIDSEIAKVQEMLDDYLITPGESVAMIQKILETKEKQMGLTKSKIDIDVEMKIIKELLDDGTIDEEECESMVGEIMRKKYNELKEEIVAIKTEEKNGFLQEVEKLDELLLAKAITQKEYDDTKSNLVQKFVEAK